MTALATAELAALAEARKQLHWARDEYERAVVHAREAGASLRAIAEAAGLSHTQVARIVAR